MSRSLHIAGRATADVEEIFNWLAARTISGAISWYFAFDRAVNQLRDDPEQFAGAAESAALGRDLRQVLFKTRRGRRYRIIFAFDAHTVTVLRVRGPGQPPIRRRDLPAS